jgi:arylsulfatase A-like enzyme
MRVPGLTQPGLRIPGMFQHCDLAPTICDTVNRDPSPQFDGCSLLPAASGEGAPGYDAIYSCEASRFARWAVRTPEWKLIKCVTPGQYHVDYDELYHVAEDPGETKNLVAERPDLYDQLELQLTRWRDAKLGVRPDPVRVEMSQGSTMEDTRLDGLEYMGMSFDEWIRYYQERFHTKG